MRHARRFIATFIATLIGVAAWCVATTTTAYAQLPPDPVGGGFPSPPPPPPPPTSPELWKFVIVAAIAALLTVAVVGLIASLRQTRPSQRSGMLHA